MTNQEIITRGELIRDETVTGANTAQRVGEAFVAIGENLEEVKDITANQQESISDILGIKTFEFNFGKSATGGGYVSRFVEYQLVQGHTYRLSMETESAYTTYLSFRGNDGIAIGGQTNIGNVVGSYTVDFECTADAPRLYLTVVDQLSQSTENKLFEVKVSDLSALSLHGLEARVESNNNNIQQIGNNINNIEKNVIEIKGIKTFEFNFGKNVTNKYAGRFVEYQLVQGHTYRLSMETESAYTTYLSFRGNDGIAIGGQTNIGNVVGSYTVDFECTADAPRLYLTVGESMPTSENDKIFEVNVIDLSILSLQRLKITVDSLENGFSLISSSSNGVQKVLGIISHDEKRDIVFAKTGYFVNNLGEVESSQNWYTSQPIHLFAGETIEINCSSTSSWAPVIVKVNVGTDAFPSQDQEASYNPLVFSSNVVSEHNYYAKEECYVILQYWRKNGSPSIYSNSNRLVDIEKRLSNIENGVTNIPEDYLDEQNRIYRELIDRVDTNATFIAFNTDQHFSKGEENAENPIHTLRGLESLVKIARIIPIDLIVLGGDVAGYRQPSQTVEGIIDDINILNQPFSDINTKCVSLSGNHDAYQNNRGMTAFAMYNLHFKRSKCMSGIEHEGTDNLNSFFDDTDRKIRYIFLDTFTQNGRSGVRDYDGSNQPYVNQDIRALVWSFLKNALNTMGEGYKAIIFSHNPLTNEFNGGAPYKEYQDGTNRRSAFEGNLDLSTSVGGDTTTINDYADKIIACICGHEHVDAYAIGGSGILYITTTTAAPHTVRVGIDDAGTIPNQRTLDTVTETAFDFFVVNTSEETIEALRFGQGSNRKWKYGSGARLIEYRNCVSGKVSIPSLTLTFTESEDGQPISGGDVISVQCDADGRFEAYLKLATEYDISSDGHTLDTTYVEVNENVNLGYINIS